MPEETPKLMDDAEMGRAVRHGFIAFVREKLGGGYNSPMEKALKLAIDQVEPALVGLARDATLSALNDAEFVAEIKVAFRSKLASLLVQRFGGEMEKQVNALKSDPATRARITVALDNIVQGKAG